MLNALCDITKTRQKSEASFAENLTFKPGNYCCKYCIEETCCRGSLWCQGQRKGSSRAEKLIFLVTCVKLPAGFLLCDDKRGAVSLRKRRPLMADSQARGYTTAEVCARQSHTFFLFWDTTVKFVTLVQNL